MPSEEDRVSRIAKTWSHGPTEAIGRLRSWLNSEDVLRFDARDREALAVVLLHIERLQELVQEAQVFCDRWINQRGRWR